MSTASCWPSAAHPMVNTLQLVGSKALGGAERWFVRFVRALEASGERPDIGIRSDSELASVDFGGLRVHRLPFRTVWDPWSQRAVSRLVQRLRPEIVQTYMGRATRLTRSPPGGGAVHLARLGGYYDLGPYRHAHAWIGNTRGLCDYLVRSGLPADRVFHIYNFIDEPAVSPPARIGALRHDLGIPPEALVLLAPGRFVEVKGHAYLLDALARLPAELGGRPLRLVLLGDGVLRGALRRQARQAGIDGRVVWGGWRDDPDPFYQLADLVVFPSLEAETLGNVILEAWAHVRPLVTSLFRGAREIARHGEDAWCVPCGDSQALADGIRRVALEPALSSSLVAAGRRRVQNDFGRGPIIRQYLDLYNRLVGS